MELSIEIDSFFEDQMTGKLFSYPIDGLSILDEDLYNNLKKSTPDVLVDPRESTGKVTVNVFFNIDDYTSWIGEDLKDWIESRDEYIKIIKEEEMADESWATNWQQYYDVTVIGNVVIKPSWLDHELEEGQVLVEMDPGLAFGTGTHPTTRGCLLALQNIDLAGKSLLDMGTGTGILSITALKLGAKNVLATDISPDAIERARACQEINRVEFPLVKTSLTDGIYRKYHVICANLLAELIIEALPGIGDLINPGGILIFSGIISEKRDQVVAEIEKLGWDLVKEYNIENWRTLLVHA